MTSVFAVRLPGSSIHNPFNRPLVTALRTSIPQYLTPLLLMGLFLLPLVSAAQHSRDELEEGLARTNGLVTSLKSDSAIILADSLLAILRASGELETPLGLDLQLATATAHENDNRDSTAMAMLLYIREESRKRELWETYASCGLALANLYQNVKRPESAREALLEVKQTVAVHGLDSLYPAFAVRMAYWFQVFSKNRDSAVYYAGKVLQTAPRFNDTVNLVNGHMLLGFLTDTVPEISIAHFKQGIHLCRAIGDHVGASYMLSGLATRMMAQDRYGEALLYNDSSVLAARQAVEEGRVSGSSLSHALESRGEIYYSLGILDSAYYYMHEGHDLEIENLKELEHQKALEIDARYNDQLKAARIAEQSRQLEDESQRVNLLLIIIALALGLGVVLAFYTARFRKLNRENLEQAEQLRSLDAAKSHFFANVSHELRTPLTLIQGPISTLRKDGNLTARQQRLLELASSSGDKLQDLVNQILELQKLEAGQPELVTSPTPLREYLQQCVEAFSSLGQQKHLAYYTDVFISPDLVAPLDREKCRIILANLLANAFKFTPMGGEVSVSITYEQSILSIEVSDTGAGIHPDDLPNVFNRFYQTKRTDRPAEGGTGIGLALCKEYVNLFGGTIEVHSEEGEGATFLVTFPLEATSVAASPSILAEPELVITPEDEDLLPIEDPDEEDKPRILVVEDNVDLQDYLRFILSKHYRIETADHGEMALERLAAMPDCQLVLSDIMMPVMDGYQLLERLKNTDATRHLPVIMLTARGDTGDRLRALRIGVDDYLTKPFEEEELLVRIANLLRYQAARIPEEVTDDEEPADEGVTKQMSEADREWLTSIEDYVRENFSDERLSVPLLAQEFAMSDSTLLRQLKRLTGLSTLQYLQEVRLSEARRFLEAGAHASISEVADAVGYRDARSFSRAFKKRYGKLPSEYKEESSLS